MPSSSPSRLAPLATALLLVACKDPPPAPPPTPSGSAAGPLPASSATAAPLPPIDAALPATAPKPLDRRAECAKEICPLAHLVPDEVRPALSDGAPIVLWEHSIAERSSLTFPRDEVVELSGVVLDGSLDLTAMETAPQSTPVGGRWTGFRAPGGGVTLTGTAGKAVRVALVVAAMEAGAGLSAHVDQRDRPGAPPGWNWKTRPRPISTFAFSDRPDIMWGGGAYHARIGWETDDKTPAVIDLLRMSAPAGVDEHIHTHEWECIALLQGDGTMVRRPGSTEERVALKPGAIVTVPVGMKHAWRPSSKADFFAIQVYSPPGPEQRFKKLAGKVP